MIMGAFTVGWLFLILVALAADPASAAVWLAVGLPVLGVLLVTTWVVWKVTLPAPPKHVTLTVESREVARGGPVHATLTARSSLAEPVDVGLVCTEIYYYLTGRRAEMVRHTTAWESWQSVGAGASGEQSLSFEIPDDTPYSFEGKYLMFDWKVEVRVQRKGRFDRRRSVPIWVLP